MTVPFRLLRDALWRLSLEPDEQRKALARTVVTDELVLDLENAASSLAYASKEAGMTLSEEVLAGLTRLDELLTASPDDPLWDDEALDRHPAWAEAREISRHLILLLPQSR